MAGCVSYLVFKGSGHRSYLRLPTDGRLRELLSLQRLKQLGAVTAFAHPSLPLYILYIYIFFHFRFLVCFYFSPPRPWTWRD